MRKWLSLLLLTGLITFVHPVEASSSTTDQVNKLKRMTIDGYTMQAHLVIQLNSSKMREVVSLFQRENEYYSNDYLVLVHEWKGGKWQQVYKREMLERGYMQFVTSGKMGASEKVVVGAFEGSGNYMDAFVIGSPDGKKIQTMHQRGGYFYGNATIVNGTLYYMNSSVTIQKYKVQNGKVVSAGKPNGRDDRLVAGNPKVWFGLTARGETTDYVGKRVVTVKVGDRIGIGRYGVSDTRGYAYRMYTTSGGSLEWDFKRPALIAKRKGTDIIQFEPEPYAEPIELKIIVK